MADINYIDTISLGKIVRFAVPKEANMDIIPFAGQSEDQTIVADTLGVTKTFEFQTNIIGDFDTINNTIYLLDSIIDGAQFGYSIFYSPYIISRDQSIRKRGGYGVTTSTSASKLNDSTKNFLSRGILSSTNSFTPDKVKNLITGEVTTITLVNNDTQLSLAQDIFKTTGTPYVYTVNIPIKLLKIEPIWEPPALNKCLLNLTAVQVKRD